MNDLQTSFQIVGWGILGLCAFFLVAAIITSSIKQIIMLYYASKTTYAKMLLDMEAPGSLVKMVEEIEKKHQDKLVGKGS